MELASEILADPSPKRWKLFFACLVSFNFTEERTLCPHQTKICAFDNTSKENRLTYK